eukprot:scaffold52181_cov29-Phaeocystis_antarctica.AAC.1
MACLRQAAASDEKRRAGSPWGCGRMGGSSPLLPKNLLISSRKELAKNFIFQSATAMQPVSSSSFMSRSSTFAS